MVGDVSYVVAMPFVWLVMRRLMLKRFADAIQWLALQVWFWTFLLAMGAIAGGQMSSWWLAYGISTGLVLLIGLVARFRRPSSRTKCGCS